MARTETGTTNMQSIDQIKKRTIEILNAAEDLLRENPNNREGRQRLIEDMYDNWRDLVDPLTDLGDEFEIEPSL